MTSQKKKTEPQGAQPDQKGDRPKAPPQKQARSASAARPAQDADPEEASPEEASFPIVGIGASAGGIQALETLFENMPVDCGMAFVVVQHLDPHRESLMRSLLSKKTRLPVNEVREGLQVASGQIYIKVPGRDIVLRNRTLSVLEAAGDKDGSRLPIDVFFRSLAEDQQDKAICVVLSGAGSDGTLGAKAVKGEGGLVVVQDETQAQYDRMPSSVIEAGLADMILPVEQIPVQLMRFVQHRFILPLPSGSEEDKNEQELRSILMLVRTQTGHDFSQYKRNTVRRRIERRMALQHIESLPDYRRYLRQDPQEVKLLFMDLTINVTRFFRDPHAFDILKGAALKPLLQNRAHGTPVRIWVPGCSTGEEAYSIAMLISEQMEELETYEEVKIFATDINSKAIETARNGLYPESITVDLSEKRIKRFFSKKGHHYRVDSKIREMIVFANHDVIRDPPFSNMDLISCRNMLIYMDTPLQKKLLPVFHYALKPKGYLFLGTSETTGGAGGLFVCLNKAGKIYRPRQIELQQLVHFELPQSSRARAPNPEPAAAPLAAPQPRKPSTQQIREVLEKAIMQKYAPPTILLDEKCEILYFHGNTGRFLSPPRGEPTFNLFEMVGGELHFRLSQAIQTVKRVKEPLKLEKVQCRHNDSFLTLDVNLTPLSPDGRRKDWILVEFNEREKPPGLTVEQQKRTDKMDTDSREIHLETTLKTVKQELQATIEELETSNEELKSANEELQANNEELQSTNEELESSKEELQSTNEELETLNTELYKKNQELLKAEDDLNNIFAASEIATIYLDNDLRIQRYTPQTTEVMNLKAVDEGRRISDITCNLEYQHLEKDAEDVLDKLVRREMVVRSKTGKSYIMRIVPYRTRNNLIEGVVITFLDVTEVNKLDPGRRQTKGLLEDAIAVLREPVMILDKSKTVWTVNHAFYRTFKTSPKETLNLNLFEIGGKRWDSPELQRFLDEILPGDGHFEDYVIELAFPRTGRRQVAVSGCRIASGSVSIGLILLAFQERTPQRQ